MLQLFSGYFFSFIHPFYVHNRLKKKNDFFLPQGSFVYQEDQVRPVYLPRPTYVDALFISWIFAMIKAFYALATMSIGVKLVQWLWPKEGPMSFFTAHSIGENKFLIFFILLEVALFPISALVYVKFWDLIIRFFLRLYNLEIPREQEVIEEILAVSFSSHLFLVFPIFGEIAKHLSSLIYLFAGLRNRAQMSVLQALIVLISPLFIAFFALLVIGLYIVLIISMI